MSKYTWKVHNGKMYINNQLDGKFCLVVCKVVGVECANEFLKDNPDCGILHYIGGLAIIAFNNDLGIEL